MQDKPLVIFDGAHNADKIQYLANKMRPLLKNKKRRLHLVTALRDPRNPREILQPLTKLADRVYATRFISTVRKAIDPHRIASVFQANRVSTFLDPQDALTAALKAAKPGDCILVAGSFFLCSNLRSRWVKEWELLK
jgi:folylpolyglutamate synthase/dihydropteroate synthase